MKNNSNNSTKTNAIIKRIQRYILEYRSMLYSKGHVDLLQLSH